MIIEKIRANVIYIFCNCWKHSWW